MPLELTSVADDEIVLFDTETRALLTFAGLDPDADYVVEGVVARTLPRPPGELLATFATVNDVHFGEVECGVIEGLELGPILAVPAGAEPYPEVMNRGVIAGIEALASPAQAVVVKGDLTTNGTVEEYERFLEVYGGAFGDRLVHVRGNHDAYHGGTFAAASTQEVALPGAWLGVLDTATPGHSNGRVTDGQLDFLDDLGARAEDAGVPVLVFGHHHVWSPDSHQRPDGYFGIIPDDSERLIDVFVRRPSLRGYFAGHTHRNRVRYLRATGDVPWVEVACTKDFPGAWAEYRVFEGGVLQIGRRAPTPEAIEWAEETRQMFGGLYPQYAFGEITDRCFAV